MKPKQIADLLASFKVSFFVGGGVSMRETRTQELVRRNLFELFSLRIKLKSEYFDEFPIVNDIKSMTTVSQSVSYLINFPQVRSIFIIIN